MLLDGVDDGRTVWWILGLVLAGATAFVLYAFVGTFVFGVFIYYATRPIHRRVNRRLERPGLSAALALVTLALPAIALVSYALLIVTRELSRLTEAFDPSLLGVDTSVLDRVRSPEILIEDWESYVDPGNVADAIGSLGSIAESAAVVGIGLVHLFVMLALAFYLLKDGPQLSRWFFRRFGDESGLLREYVRAVDRDFGNVFFGNILNAVITGAIGVVAYSALNAVAAGSVSIPAPALVGLLTGVASLIPVVGMKLVYVPVAGIMTANAVGGVTAVTAGSTDPTGLSFVAAFVLVSFVVVDTIPDLLLRPYVSGRSLHVGAVMLAYTLGPLLFGWYGIFLTPMLLIAVVHFARVVLPELVTRETVRPAAIDPTNLVGGAGRSGAEATPSPAGDRPVNDGASDGASPSTDEGAAPAASPEGTADDGEGFDYVAPDSSESDAPDEQ